MGFEVHTDFDKKFKKAQWVVDSEVLKRCDPLVPMDNGKLKESGITGTTIGSGIVTYTAPYAKRQYYENSGHGNHNANGLRGKLWFERMKASDLEDIKNKVRGVFDD